MHGIGDVDADEIRRRQRERRARQADQHCCVDGCKFRTKRADSLRKHQASMHAIGEVEAAAERQAAENLYSIAVSARVHTGERARPEGDTEGAVT